MADDGSAQSTSVWPIPRFRFEVRWDSAVMSFQEVTGTDLKSQGNEVAIETIEIAHEGLSVGNA